jgi:4-hydroxy-tetrahydrodipicolinate synthase
MIQLNNTSSNNMNKNNARLNNCFKGLGVAVITPFKKDGSVDFESLEKLIDKQLNEGVDFFCVLGTTAETPTLNTEEREAITTFFINKVNGRVPILLGAGGNDTRKVVEGLKNLPKGIDGLLIVAPYYNKPSQEGIYQHYKAVAEATDLPIVLYNVPGRTGVNITAETTLRLARDFNNIIATKEASGNLAQIEHIIVNAPEGFEVLSGDDGIAYELMLAGAVGAITVIGNSHTLEFGKMIHAIQRSDLNEAKRIHHSLNELYVLLFADGNPSGIKSVLALQGEIENVLRLPLVPASENTQQKIKAFLSKKD